MARTIQQIQNDITKQVQKNIPQLTNTSKFSVWYMFTYIFAVATSLLEQIFELLQRDVNKVASTIPPNTFLYLQDKILNLFQYSSTKTQIIKLQTDATQSNYLQPYYDVTDKTLNIVSQVSLNNSFTIPGTLIVKAIGSNRTNLSADQVNSLIYFLNVIGVPGITYIVNSKSPDTINGGITINYNKNYLNSQIQALFNSFFDNYVSNISFNGNFILTDFMRQLQANDWVNDFVINNLNVFSNGDQAKTTNLVIGNTVIGTGDFLQNDNTSGYFAYNEIAQQTNFRITITPV